MTSSLIRSPDYSSNDKFHFFKSLVTRRRSAVGCLRRRTPRKGEGGRSAIEFSSGSRDGESAFPHLVARVGISSLSRRLARLRVRDIKRRFLVRPPLRHEYGARSGAKRSGGRLSRKREARSPATECCFLSWRVAEPGAPFVL